MWVFKEVSITYSGAQENRVIQKGWVTEKSNTLKNISDLGRDNSSRIGVRNCEESEWGLCECWESQFTSSQLSGELSLNYDSERIMASLSSSSTKHLISHAVASYITIYRTFPLLSRRWQQGFQELTEGDKIGYLHEYRSHVATESSRLPTTAHVRTM